MLNVLDLFSGIGGFSYGFERTGGFRTAAFCERDAYATRVLNNHWPAVPVFPDVCEVGAASLAAAGIGRIDVVCGGFPCQDISLAGKGAGLAGERSGLWFEMLRVIDETRPAFVVAENVSALRSRGLEECLGGLASIGYDAEWHCIPAAAVGAPHRRDRVWIGAYPARELSHRSGAGTEQARRDEPANACGDVADSDRDNGRPGRAGRPDPSCSGEYQPVRPFRDADSAGLAQREGQRSDARTKLTAVVRTDWWVVEPRVGRVADGIPARVDRLRCLGNSIVPQIAEMIGRAILLDHRVA